MVDKQKIIHSLIEQGETLIQELSNNEKGELENMSQDEQDMKSYAASPEEGMIASIIRVNNTIHHLEERINVLKSINLEEPNQDVHLGALVKLNTGYFLVSSSFEPVDVGGIHLVGISISSPLFQTMKGLKKGDKFHIKGRTEEHEILEIF